MPNYLPLVPGLVLEYEGDAPSGPDAGSSRRLELLDVTEQDETTTARCRWTFKPAAGKQSSREASVTRGGDWASCDASFLDLPVTRLFPLQPKVGASWSEGRWGFEVAALDAKVRVADDAGVPSALEKCLRVVWFFDEGGGELFFAPDIGLVRAASTDEQYPFAFSLLRVRRPSPGRRR